MEGIAMSNIAAHLAQITDLTPSAYRVLAALISFADKNATCFPSVKAIVERTKLSESSIFRALKQIKNAGYVTIKHRFSKGTELRKSGQRSSLYIIHGIVDEAKENEVRGIVESKDFCAETYVQQKINHFDTPPLSTVDTPYNYTKEPLKEKNIIKKEKREIVVADSAKPNDPPRGNNPCVMTTDYKHPARWVTWAMIVHHLSEKYVLEHIQQFKNKYAVLTSFKSAGWESLWRTYLAEVLEKKRKFEESCKIHVCSCGRHKSQGVTPDVLASNLGWQHYVHIGLNSTRDIKWLESYEQAHGKLYADDDPRLYKNKWGRK